MFSKSYDVVRNFVIPIVVSSRAGNGKCSSAIGTAVVVNRDGWILTSAHILQLIEKQRASIRAWRAYRRQQRELENDTASVTPRRKQKLKPQDLPPPDSTRDNSVWWGRDGVEIFDVQMDISVDLATGRLEPFNPETVRSYPIFKTPGIDYRPGRSLCRLGFAFHEIVPEFDEENNAFVLPPGSVPLPLFPLDGLFTRVLHAPAPMGDGKNLGKFIETSSPGLRGQSGGPIFDAEGAVWAIQSHTRQYALGFAPRAPGTPSGQVEHQFLNAGVGVHAEAILAFLDRHGIEHHRTK